jgi:hypothetical protein
VAAPDDRAARAHRQGGAGAESERARARPAEASRHARRGHARSLTHPDQPMGLASVPPAPLSRRRVNGYDTEHGAGHAKRSEQSRLASKIHTRLNAGTPAHTPARAHTTTQACMHARTHANTNTHTHTHMNTHATTHTTHAHTHAHTRTHTSHTSIRQRNVACRPRVDSAAVGRSPSATGFNARSSAPAACVARSDGRHARCRSHRRTCACRALGASGLARRRAVFIGVCARVRECGFLA